MYIATDNSRRIRQIADTAEQIIDPGLTVIEIDRQRVFGNWTDRRILAYCYKPVDGGYSIYPYMDLTQIIMEDNREAAEQAVREAQIAITNLDIKNIEAQQAITELELSTMEGSGNV